MSKNKEIQIIAHGGYSAKYPENTEQSFFEAVKYQPDVIEMDVVQHPRTGELICFHPSGMSSGSGTFSSEAVERQLVQGDKFPQVQEILNQLPSNIKVLLDFKQPSQALFQQVVSDSNFDISRIIVGVRSMHDYQFICDINSQIQTLALFSHPDEYSDYAEKGGKFFRLWEKDVTPERVQALQEAGVEVWVTPGHKATDTQPRTAGEVNEEKLKWLQSLMVNAILVNDIKFASEYLRKQI